MLNGSPYALCEGLSDVVQAHEDSEDERVDYTRPEPRTLDAQAHLATVQASSVAAHTCPICGTAFTGAAASSRCTACARKTLALHLRKIQDRIVSLDRERADLRGQMESCIKNFKPGTPAAEQLAPTCFLCEADCSQLYALIGDAVICQDCAIKSGLESHVDDSKMQQCKHEVSIFRCRACRHERITEREELERATRIPATSRLQKRAAKQPTQEELDAIEEI